MKAYLKISSLILLSVFLFTSCDNESLSEDIQLQDPTTQPQPGEVLVDELIGQWLIEDYTITTTNTLTQGGVEIVSVAETEFASGDQIITFTEDNQYSADGTITIDVSTFINGVFAGQTTETVDNFNSGTWSIDGNQLIMNDSVTGEFPVTIITLNTQSLVFFLEVDNESLGLPVDNPLFGEVTGEGTVTYSKVQ
jgi:hypothetical protein